MLGTLSLRTLLLELPTAFIDRIMDTDVVSVRPNAPAVDVAAAIAKYDLLAVPVLDDEGRVVRWYISWTDIEDRKRLEERLRQENIALREEINQTSMFEEIVGSSSALRNRDGFHNWLRIIARPHWK